MKRVKVPARIRRQRIRGREKCGKIPQSSVVSPRVLVLGRALDEEALVVGGEVHDTADGRLIYDGKCAILITSNLPQISHLVARRSPLVPGRRMFDEAL